MKCPNIWCNDRAKKTSACMSGGVINYKNCKIRIAYEKEYNCNSCGSVCVEPEKDSEGNVICPEEENNNE